MMRGRSKRRLRLDRYLRLLLVIATLFAAWHVATHDVDIAGDSNGHGECQVCRLNHVPTVKPAVLAALSPLLLLGLVCILPLHHPVPRPSRRILGARAPPLF